MHVSKRVDQTRLHAELDAAGVPVAGLVVVGTDPNDPLEQDVLQPGPDGLPVELPPEAAPVVEAHDATTQERAATFERHEDAERLALVAERAADDPAYAALADLTLGKERYA